jgi:hypothetical protein
LHLRVTEGALALRFAELKADEGAPGEAICSLYETLTG